MIEIENLCWHHERFGKIENLTLSIAEGETLGLLGSFDAGATALFELLIGLLSPSSGSIRMTGHDLAGDSGAERRSKIGYQPYFLGHYADMSVTEYLDFFAACHKFKPWSAWPARRRDLIGLAGLTGREEEDVESLGRELKERLGLARMLTSDPPLLLIDQPWVGLDPAARPQMRELLAGMRRPGRTIIVSSNVLTDLVGLCDRIAALDEGRLLAIGPTDQVAEHLASARMIEVELIGPAEPILPLVRANKEIIDAAAEDHLLYFSLIGSESDPLRVVQELAEATGVTVMRFREHQTEVGLIGGEEIPPAT